jgi:agmatinase
MFKNNANMPSTGICSFFKSPIIANNDMGNFDAIICGVPYDWGVGFRPGSRFGPRAIREMSTRFSLEESGYWDIETGKRMLENIAIADVGDVDILYSDYRYNSKKIKEMVESIKLSRAIPVFVGGDHSISFPIVEGLSEKKKFDVIQLDAHLDFKDNILGLKYTNSSPIKRISELSLINNITSIGIRGTRTKEEDYKDSINNGNNIITSYQLQKSGVSSILKRVNYSDNAYVTIDIDVLDPSIAPGTGSPEPEGLSFTQLKQILKDIAKNTNVIGFDIVEVNPQLDFSGLTSLVAAKIIIEFLGLIMLKR